MPDKLRPLSGRTEIRESLGTSDPDAARVFGRVRSVEVDGTFARARQFLEQHSQTALTPILLQQYQLLEEREKAVHHPPAVPKETLSEAEIRHMVLAWFVSVR